MSVPGLALVAAAAAFMSAANAVIHGLGPGVPTSWVVFLRCAAPVPALLALCAAQGVAWRSARWRALAWRGVAGAAAVGCFFWAVPRMPLATAAALGYTAPLFLALWAGALGERLGWHGAGALLAAWLGAALIIGPSAGEPLLPALAALGCGFFSALALTAVKSLTRSEPASRIVLYSAAVGALIFLPWALARPMPDARTAALLALVGLLLSAGQLALTAGVARLPVLGAGVATLLGVGANALLGWALWSQSLGAAGLWGCVLLVLGVVGVNRALRPAPERPPVPIRL